jgi:P27 family predicted phage terminase small subunit
LKNSTPKPPDHLSPEAAAWWDRLASEYGIGSDGDEAGVLLLQTAMEAFDRMRACQASIDAEGVQVRDRFQQVKPHPLLPAERDSRAQMLAALKALHLDVTPPTDPVLKGRIR